MKVEIFKNYEEFKQRADKSVNGISMEFVEHLLTCSPFRCYTKERLLERLTNDGDNWGCWNCLDCRLCTNCAFCVGCTLSANLSSCEFMEGDANNSCGYSKHNRALPVSSTVRMCGLDAIDSCTFGWYIEDIVKSAQKAEAEWNKIWEEHIKNGVKAQ